MFVQIIARVQLKRDGKMMSDGELIRLDGMRRSQVYELEKTDDYEDKLHLIADSFEEECKTLHEPHYEIVEWE